jgi:hypothetical protein
MGRGPLRPALVLSAWTFLVWTSRIRNIWTDDSLTTAGQLGRTALALAFTALAAVTAGAWLRYGRGASPPPGWVSRLVSGFAAWTIGVWAIRAVQIGAADHGTAFVAVHTALAVVSTVLAVWAHRAATRPSAPTAGEPVGSAR